MSQPAARLTDKCNHPNVISSGSPDTVIGNKQAARLGDLVNSCPRCGARQGKIVKGSSTVFINSKPAARITDEVDCRASGSPPPGGGHAPITTYSVKPEDNYVAAVFSDDGFLLVEEEGDEEHPPPPDRPPPRPPATFFDGLSLDIDLGQRAVSKEDGDGSNTVDKGEFTVIVGG